MNVATAVTPAIAQIQQSVSNLEHQSSSPMRNISCQLTMPVQKVQAPNPTQSAPYAMQRPPLQGSQNTPTSRHGQYAGHQGIAGDISTPAAEQRIPTGIVYSPPEVATALSDPHLRRLHDAAATWKRSLKHQPHSLSTKSRPRGQRSAC